MMVVADSTRLEQVFMTFLTNAAKDTDPGGHIWVAATPDPDNFLVRMRKTGEGIARAMLPRIFTMFTHVESSTQRSRGDLGIGLSLVKNLVDLHGETVTVASAGVGRGCEFTVHLPRA